MRRVVEVLGRGALPRRADFGAPATLIEHFGPAKQVGNPTEVQLAVDRGKVRQGFAGAGDARGVRASISPVSAQELARTVDAPISSSSSAQALGGDEPLGPAPGPLQAARWPPALGRRWRPRIPATPSLDTLAVARAARLPAAPIRNPAGLRWTGPEGRKSAGQPRSGSRIGSNPPGVKGSLGCAIGASDRAAPFREGAPGKWC